MDKTSKRRSVLSSTLELFIHDAAAGAPEPHHALTTPETTKAHDAPQVAIVEGMQAFYNNEFPEAISDLENEDNTKATTPDSSKARRSSPKVTIIVTAVIVSIIVGVAVGVGVGLGLKRVKGDPKSSMPSPTSSPIPIATNRGMLNDSSLAVIQTPTGDRHLFFQDDSGTIRQAAYIRSSNPWKANLGFTVASDAKNHSPIATFQSQFQPQDSYVFYVLNNDSLACQVLDQGHWSDCSSRATDTAELAHFTVATESRHLAVMEILNQRKSTVLVFYEPPTGGVALLNGSDVAGWQNSSSILSTHPGFQLSGPFSVNSHHGPSAVFASDRGNWTRSYAIRDTSSHDALQLANCSDGFNTASTQDYDNVLLLARDSSYRNYWIENETLLVSDLQECDDSQIPQPTTPFRYGRLAGFNDVNSTATFIYHQINATAIAEDQWDAQVGNWESFVIHIETA